jgi:hypothetical protein
MLGGVGRGKSPDRSTRTLEGFPQDELTSGALITQVVHGALRLFSNPLMDLSGKT